MGRVTVEVQINPGDILDQLSEGGLASLGLTALDDIDVDPEPGDWPLVHEAIRRADFHKAAELITSIAAECGVDLPPFAMARVA
ncbi:MAG: hypothetical protein GAK28_03188 [Luteibacter sp.]|uniref:hypothetical protein n=1 Tax=Luteibacter sp. TaxID=1886636 RepID=UPI001381A5D5|nr:hypothetical protein [Luteibacter sp.]KAF1005436.1 MAG: hypothetical protein GAK28_03188 [Luteibacter sp.]